MGISESQHEAERENNPALQHPLGPQNLDLKFDPPVVRRPAAQFLDDRKRWINVPARPSRHHEDTHRFANCRLPILRFAQDRFFDFRVSSIEFGLPTLTRDCRIPTRDSRLPISDFAGLHLSTLSLRAARYSAS